MSCEPGPSAEPDTPADRPPQWLLDTLVSCGLLLSAEASTVSGTALPGGVSSDVWFVSLPRGPVCVKRALPTLRVAAVWEAPTLRYASEAAWLERAHRIEPAGVPQLLGVDDRAGAIVLSWLDPAGHRLWKSDLLAGRIDSHVAAALGARLAHFHDAMSARVDPSSRADFDHVDLFEALRLSPYLRSTAAAHPALEEQLEALCDRFGAAASTVVHGDVSPKNVLVGPNGPVLLDAECACFGDPAFDVAFLLTHLLLKARNRPQCADDLASCARRFWTAYAGSLAEQDRSFEARVTAYWPALVLARIDGRSPVEYLSDDVRTEVRADVIDFVAHPRPRLSDLGPLWSARR